MKPTPSGSATSTTKRAIIVCIMTAIALIHLSRLGSHLSGTLHALYYSYFSDIVGPFGIYFLLCLNDGQVGFLGGWRARALLVFAVASATEAAQAFGIPLLGRTYDPLDFVMFAAGALLAAAVDQLVCKQLVPGWSSGKTS